MHNILNLQSGNLRGNREITHSILSVNRSWTRPRVSPKITEPAFGGLALMMMEEVHFDLGSLKFNAALLNVPQYCTYLPNLLTSIVFWSSYRYKRHRLGRVSTCCKNSRSFLFWATLLYKVVFCHLMIFTHFSFTEDSGKLHSGLLMC